IESTQQAYLLSVETTKSASREYQTASVTVSSKSQDMKQIAPALAPERPVRPRILINTIMGFLLGLLVFGSCAYIIRNYRQASLRTPVESEEVNVAQTARAQRI